MVVRHERTGQSEFLAEADAVQLIRTAGQVLGAAISYAVNLIDASVVIIGGDFAHAREPLLAGIRSVVNYGLSRCAACSGYVEQIRDDRSDLGQGGCPDVSHRFVRDSLRADHRDEVTLRG